MSYKTIEQVTREEAVQGVKKLQPSQTFKSEEVSVRFVCDDVKGLKSKAEVYYKGLLVGWVKVSMSFVAVFEAKS